MNKIKLKTILSLFIVGLLVFGGWHFLKPSKPQKGDFILVGKMSIPRYGHTAILLDDGNVLIIDKITRKIINYKGVTSAELYNPETKKFTPVGNMNECRDDYSATKLNNGKILIAGGRNLKSTELYNPETKKFEKGPDMNARRENHTATLLKDGRVLIAGGQGGLCKSEIYDPIKNKFEIAPKMNIPRFLHSAVLLKDNRILILGGIGYSDKKFYVLSSAEIYDPETNRFKLAGNMNIARINPNIYLLKSGNVLISGGTGNGHGKNIFLREIEMYNPKIGKFKIMTKRQSIPDVRTEALLEDDKILYTGGCTGVGLSLKCYRTSEIYDPVINKFIAEKNMHYPRDAHIATLLKDGNVLITGSVGTGRTAELLINRRF